MFLFVCFGWWVLKIESDYAFFLSRHFFFARRLTFSISSQTSGLGCSFSCALIQESSKLRAAMFFFEEDQIVCFCRLTFLISFQKLTLDVPFGVLCFMNHQNWERQCFFGKRRFFLARLAISVSFQKPDFRCFFSCALVDEFSKIESDDVFLEEDDFFLQG